MQFVILRGYLTIPESARLGTMSTCILAYVRNARAYLCGVVSLRDVIRKEPIRMYAEEQIRLCIGRLLMTRWVNLVFNECVGFHAFPNRTRTNLPDCSLFPVGVERFAAYESLPKYRMKSSVCPDCQEKRITHAMYCAVGSKMVASHPSITFACFECVKVAINESYMGEELYHAHEVAAFGRQVTWHCYPTYDWQQPSERLD